MILLLNGSAIYVNSVFLMGIEYVLFLLFTFRKKRGNFGNFDLQNRAKNPF